MKKRMLAPALLFTCFTTIAQQPAFNQNSSRSNHTRAYNQNAARSNTARMSSGNDWQFGLYSGASFGVKSNEASLFRGNGMHTGLSGQYFLGPLGLGIQGGFISSKLNTSAINQFLIDRKFPQTSTVTSTAAQNAFLMLGPSFRLGNKAQLIAGIKGGLFLNQSGGLVIGQQGALRPLYRFDGGAKNIFPGFNGSLSFSYPVGASSSIVLSTDYLRSSSSIQLFDPQRGIDIPVEQNRTFQTVNAGITFIKTFSSTSPRDAASGQATGKRSSESTTGNANNKRIQKTKTRSNQSNDRVTNTTTTDEEVSVLDPENTRVFKPKTKSNQSNDRTAPGCGPVTVKTTNPDGTVQEQTFSCPDDAVQYQKRMNGGMPNRISMNVTTPKQTQGSTFGEKVNQGMQSAGSHIVSGKIIRTGSGGGAGGIVTNSQRNSGGVNNTAGTKGIATNFYTREAGSGQATGRRQYEPLFFETDNQTGVSNKMVAVKNNPLYEERTNGENVLFQNRTSVRKEECDDSDAGIANADVYLIDRNTGVAVASSKTNACGNYWFANVPDGNYSVAVVAIIAGKKSYDFYSALSNKTKIDVAGEVMVPDETWQHILYTNDAQPETKAGVSTSRSNIRTKSRITIAAGDVNGDGAADYYRAVAVFTDGTSTILSEGSLSSTTSDITIPVEENNQQKAGVSTSRSKVRNINIATGDVNGDGVADFTVRGTFSDGSSRDVTAFCDVQQQPGVTQLNIAVGDVDGDGAADLIWSPRSNTGITSKTNTVNINDLPSAIINTSRSNIKNLAVATGDADGDGVYEFTLGTGFQNGDIPNQDDFTMARPGGPVKGVLIKIGREPGGEIVAQGRTNSLGEFEFTNLEPGNYRLTAETKYVLNDVTDLDLFGTPSENIVTSESNLKDKTAGKQTQGATFGEKVNGGSTNTGGTKVQDHNSSRSNKSASGIAPQPDGDSTQTKARDYNSSRSNKTASSIASFTDLLDLLNQLENQLQTDETPQNKAGVSTSRSKVRNLITAVSSVLTELENDRIVSAKQKMSNISTQIVSLQESLKQTGSAYNTISNVLKTKHETAKNSIGNIR